VCMHLSSAMIWYITQGGTVVIWDACRDLPRLVQGMLLQGHVERGHGAPHRYPNRHKLGMLLAFSCQAGGLASDGDDASANSTSFR